MKNKKKTTMKIILLNTNKKSLKKIIILKNNSNSIKGNFKIKKEKICRFLGNIAKNNNKKVTVV